MKPFFLPGLSKEGCLLSHHSNLCLGDEFRGEKSKPVLAQMCNQTFHYPGVAWEVSGLFLFCFGIFLIDFIYLFMRDTERERQRHR